MSSAYSNVRQRTKRGFPKLLRRCLLQRKATLRVLSLELRWRSRGIPMCRWPPALNSRGRRNVAHWRWSPALGYTFRHLHDEIAREYADYLHTQRTGFAISYKDFSWAFGKSGRTNTLSKYSQNCHSTNRLRCIHSFFLRFVLLGDSLESTISFL